MIPQISSAKDWVQEEATIGKRRSTSYQTELFTANGDPFWTVFIEYEPILENLPLHHPSL